jgi:hypothetical protein
MRQHERVFAAAFWLMSFPLLASAQTAVGAIDGAVKDSSGSAVAGAIVTLNAAPPAAERTTVADSAGAFHFADVAPGSYKVTVAAAGFAPWTADVAEASGENPAPLAAVLQVAPVSASVDVLPPHEVAAEQLKTEEKQRVLGVFPHYMVTYDPNAAPLSAGQKFHLGFKTLVDPVTLAGTAISAGIQQARNKYPDFGQGAQGYATYFGAQYATRLSGVMIHHVILQAVFHQDPRYFYKDTGGFWAKVAYSFETAFVCKGDNGKWQPDYSDVIGGAAASQLSRLWYPYTSRPYVRLWHDVLLSFGGRFEDHLAEQFVARHFTTHTHGGGGSRVEGILKEGTPVSLISVDDLTPNTTPNAGPAAFVLAKDVQVSGATVAKMGAVASGQVSYENGTAADPQAIHVALEKVRLKVGNVDVPLRSTAAKGAAGALQYHRLEGSGRIAIELYVNQDVPVALGK